jgi:ADP-heptose:LPS heptosyltransferase
VSDTRVRVEPVIPRPERIAGAQPPYAGVRRLAVMAEGGIDDFVWALPAFQSLRRAYPRAWCALAVSPRYVPLARFVSGCDEALADPGTGEGLAEALRRSSPDLVVDPSGGTRAAWSSARAKVPHRAGITGRFRRALFDRGVDRRDLPDDLHQVERGLTLSARAGASPDPVVFGLLPGASLDEATGHWVETQRLSPPWVLLLPGADPARASWPAAHFARLALLLRREGVGVAFALAQAQGPAGGALDEAPPEVRRLPRFHGGAPALLALVGRASAVVGNVSGPVQLSAAAGVPALSLHPPGPEWSVARTGPYSPRCRGIVADGGTAAAARRRDHLRRGADGMALISPAAVLQAVVSLL